MIDAHVHIITEKPREFTELLIKRMNEFKVSQSVIFGTPAPIFLNLNIEIIQDAVNKYPGRFIPFNCSVDFTDEDSARTMINELESGRWKGVGEIFLNNEGNEVLTYINAKGVTCKSKHFPYPENGAENPIYARIFKYCSEKQFPVMVHCINSEVMEACLSMYPGVNFIWAHADWWRISSKIVEASLGKHPNLYCDFGTHLYGKQFDLGEGQSEIASHWEIIVTRFPTRLVWGSDPFSFEHLTEEVYSNIWKIWDKFTFKMDQKTKDLIGFRNIRRLTGYKS